MERCLRPRSSRTSSPSPHDPTYWVDPVSSSSPQPVRGRTQSVARRWRPRLVEGRRNRCWRRTLPCPDQSSRPRPGGPLPGNERPIGETQQVCASGTSGDAPSRRPPTSLGRWHKACLCKCRSPKILASYVSRLSSIRPPLRGLPATYPGRHDGPGSRRCAVSGTAVLSSPLASRRRLSGRCRARRRHPRWSSTCWRRWACQAPRLSDFWSPWMMCTMTIDSDWPRNSATSATVCQRFRMLRPTRLLLDCPLVRVVSVGLSRATGHHRGGSRRLESETAIVRSGLGKAGQSGFMPSFEPGVRTFLRALGVASTIGASWLRATTRPPVARS